MKRGWILRCAVGGIALAGFAFLGLGFTHLERPDPEWTGGLHQTTAVVHVDGHMMKPDPGWGGR